MVVVCVALAITSVVAARTGGTSVGRTVGRALAIGLGTMLITLGVGHLIAF
jgi:VIT1/CCC1 family predicted Fe2+/Mn2+ transporter